MFRIHRVLLVYAVVVPLAIVLGYVIATPDMVTLGMVGGILLILVMPILIQWHHWLLVLSWNSVFIAGFLPGQVQLWALFSGISFVMALIHRFMGHRNFLRAPELTRPILILTAVVLVTEKIRGGLGLKIMGSSSYGGRHVFFILVSIIGFFALISQPIPFLKRVPAAKWFFLAGTTSAMSNLLYMIGPMAYFLYWIVPTSGVAYQMSGTWTESTVQRIAGFGAAGPFFLCFILARWGIRGIFEWDKPWRILLVVLSVVAALYSGFRSNVMFVCVLFAMQFFVEGLWKTALMPVAFLLGVLLLAPALFFANKMPGAVQRSLAFLPVEINPEIRAETEGSTEWRLGMWREVLLDVPKYLLIGKGYAIDPNDLYLVSASGSNGYEGSMLAGDYHNGPLSILVPFGLFGTLAFIWVLGAGVKVLNANYRYGDPRLRRVNATLLAYFLTQILFFVFVFGDFSAQLSVFMGFLGFSISLNGGVCRRPAMARQTVLAPSISASLAAT